MLSASDEFGVLRLEIQHPFPFLLTSVEGQQHLTTDQA